MAKTSQTIKINFLKKFFLNQNTGDAVISLYDPYLASRKTHLREQTIGNQLVFLYIVMTVIKLY